MSLLFRIALVFLALCVATSIGGRARRVDYQCRQSCEARLLPVSAGGGVRCACPQPDDSPCLNFDFCWTEKGGEECWCQDFWRS